MTSRATGPLHLQLVTQDVQLIVFAGVQLLGVMYQDPSLLPRHHAGFVKLCVL